MVLSATDGTTGGTAKAATNPERERILDAAELLFYAHGLQRVGMDQIRAEAGVSLKRLYREFPSKEHLIEAYLVRRDARWLTRLRTAAVRPDTAVERVLTVFDWLGEWFAEPGFRGCAFTNSFGELGADSGPVAAIAAAHKSEFRAVFVGLVRDLSAEHPRKSGAVAPELGEQLYLLAEGAITAAAITGDLKTAASAKAAARTLMVAATQPRATPGARPGSGWMRRLRRRR
jgi:AcrR family transcriptional regulator